MAAQALFEVNGMRPEIRRRVRSLQKPKRDPFGPDLQLLLQQMQREAVGAPPNIRLTPSDALKVLICEVYREGCFLCPTVTKPDTVEIFHVPVELAKFGQRLILYTLCADCKMDITTRRKVAEKFAAQLRDENERMGV